MHPASYTAGFVVSNWIFHDRDLSKFHAGGSEQSLVSVRVVIKTHITRPSKTTTQIIIAFEKY